MLSVIMLNVIMLNVVMLSVIMLNAVMLSVMAQNRFSSIGQRLFRSHLLDKSIFVLSWYIWRASGQV